MSLIVDITKKYKDFTLSIQFETSEQTMGILGASGSGKSLILKSIAGIVTPDRGRIILNGRTLFDSEKKMNLPPQKRKVGYLFQSYALFPKMTVEQNIGAGILGNREEKLEKVKRMIKVFCLEGMEKKYPDQLSGGQQQRVALARIIASDTEVLLLDEPFSALDYYLKEQLQEQLLDMMKDYKKDVILVTHNRDEVFRFCPELTVIDSGHLICRGRLKDIFQNPGYLLAARLTGCKNFSRAEKRSKYEIYANDWNVTLLLEQEVADNVGYVGIRAHYLKTLNKKSDDLTKSEELKLPRNAIEPELLEVIEDPFEINIFIRNKNRSCDTNENKIWWKLSKEQWYGELKEQLPEYLIFPPENILLLE